MPIVAGLVNVAAVPISPAWSTAPDLVKSPGCRGPLVPIVAGLVNVAAVPIVAGLVNPSGTW